MTKMTCPAAPLLRLLRPCYSDHRKLQQQDHCCSMSSAFKSKYWRPPWALTWRGHTRVLTTRCCINHHSHSFQLPLVLYTSLFQCQSINILHILPHPNGDEPLNTGPASTRPSAAMASPPPTHPPLLSSFLRNGCSCSPISSHCRRGHAQVRVAAASYTAADAPTQASPRL